MSDLVKRKAVPVSVAAGYIGVCSRSVRNYFNAGILDGFRSGGRNLMIYLDSIEAMKKNGSDEN